MAFSPFVNSFWEVRPHKDGWQLQHVHGGGHHPLTSQSSSKAHRFWPLHRVHAYDAFGLRPVLHDPTHFEVSQVIHQGFCQLSQWQQRQGPHQPVLTLHLEYLAKYPNLRQQLANGQIDFRQQHNLQPFKVGAIPRTKAQWPPFPLPGDQETNVLVGLFYSFACVFAKQVTRNLSKPRSLNYGSAVTDHARQRFAWNNRTTHENESTPSSAQAVRQECLCKKRAFYVDDATPSRDYSEILR